MKNTIFLLLLVTLLSVPRGSEAFCFEEAGTRYGVAPGLLWAIAKVESDMNPTALKYNKNGSYDVGIMQINSSWYQTLGPETWNNLYDPCTNIQVGARFLADCLNRYGYTWEGIGCYNAMDKDKRAIYARKVIKVINDMHRRSGVVATQSPEKDSGV